MEYSDIKRHESSNDRISNLPEHVLAHILSFLPTKDAVATTLLSSNWKFTWKNTNSLRFPYLEHHISIPCSEIKNRLMRFLDFVNRVLILHPVKYLHTFSINFESEYVEYDSRVLSNLNTWVTAAVDRNVRYFELFGTLDRHLIYFQLPNCMYTCNSLESLHLCNIVNLYPRGSVCLPNLKKLRLVDVEFGCEESVHKLISGCLSLHTLYVDRVVHDNVDTFSVQSQTLEHLTIISWDEHRSFYEWGIDGIVFRLLINAPNLKYLCLEDGMSLEILVDSLPLLNEAKISLDGDLIQDRFAKDWNSVCSLFQALRNVRLLSLNDFAYRVLRESGVSTNFPKLTELTLEHLCCEWNSLWYLLEQMTYLETLILKISLANSCDHEDHTSYAKPKVAPGCLTSCLKIVSVVGLTDEKDQLAMLGYILENARLLETMRITTAFLDTVEKFQLLQAVSKFRRLSEKCRLEFS